MANTYTQIYVHVVFAVEGRQNLIQPGHNDELQKYITGIVTAQKHKLSLAWNTTPGMSSKRATNECPNMSPLRGLEVLYRAVFYKDVTPTAFVESIRPNAYWAGWG